MVYIFLLLLLYCIRFRLFLFNVNTQNTSWIKNKRHTNKHSHVLPTICRNCFYWRKRIKCNQTRAPVFSLFVSYTYTYKYVYLYIYTQTLNFRMHTHTSYINMCCIYVKLYETFVRNKLNATQILHIHFYFAHQTHTHIDARATQRHKHWELPK